MQSTGKKRNTVDKFYTKSSVAKKLIEIIEKKLNLKGLIIEPSAGDGAFYDTLNKKFKGCLGYDIEPGKLEIIKQDFLKLNLNIGLPVPTHFIGNPPFGRQSSTAIKFIKHICDGKNSKSISFILPKSFKKDSMKKHFPLNWHLIYEEDVEENSFIVNEKEYNVPCVFQIWERKDYNRPKLQIIDPKGYKFVKKDSEDIHIAIRRVGVYAGKLFWDEEEIKNKSSSSHYFIKFDDIDNHIKIMTLYDSSIWKHNNTVGPKSISKPELVLELNKLI
jgi:hypothetical protein